MKQRLIFTLICAAALAAAPAMAQRSVSGTIAAASAPTADPAGTMAPAAAAAPAPAPAPAAASAAAPTALAMTIPTPAPAPASGGGLLQTSLALLFVIALMLGLAWLTKRFGPRHLGGGSNTVKLVGALSVGARERILVVEVGEQWIVVGASPGRMNALTTMPRQDISAAPPAAPAAGANFADWIKQTLDKRHGQ
jgi:flagellar protein FliO/FliZ